MARNARRWPAATAQRSRRIPSPASIGSTLLPPSRRRLLPLVSACAFHGVEAAALEGDLVGLDPASAPAAATGPPPRTPAPVLGRGRRSAGSRRGPGRCVPRPGSARGRGGPGSRPRPPPSRRWPGLSHGRGARRGRRRGSHPRARGRRARRRPLISPGAPGRVVVDSRVRRGVNLGVRQSHHRRGPRDRRISALVTSYSGEHTRAAASTIARRTSRTPPAVVLSSWAWNSTDM